MLAFHLAPAVVRGGFIGVDVFFVISGFLIISQLLREIETTGSVDLPRFWARRARRILPAAMLVLLAVTVTTLVAVPQHLWRQFLSEVIASAVYLQNWLLASNAVDYLAQTNAPSPVQHFWSLSVEEQFYLVVPLIMLVFARRRRVLFAALMTVAALSLASSIVVTALSPETAFFITPTRAWEFVAGGLLAFLPALTGPLKAVLSWLGIALIVAAALLFTAETPMPGLHALLPVAGAALVIVAGRAAGTAGLFALRPVQYLGDISYSVYLWHWPLIVLLPLISGAAIGWRAAAFVLVATLVLAALSTRFVENPLRRPGTRSWPVFVGALASIALVGGIAGGGLAAQNAANANSAAELQQAESDCFAAAALANDCAPQPLLTDPAFAASDEHGVEGDDCGGGTVVGPIGNVVECAYGDLDSATTVVLVGDSHAQHWMPAIEAIALERHWRISTLVRSSCPFGDLPQTTDGRVDESCIAWREEALDRILELRPAAVFTSSLGSYGYELLDFSLGTPDEQVAGFTGYFETMAGSGIPVYVFRDTPYLAVAAPECLATSDDCEFSRASVLDAHPDSQWIAAQAVEGVTAIDLLPYICGPDTCSDTVGGVVVYQDRHHLTQTYALSLTPYLDAMIAEFG